MGTRPQLEKAIDERLAEIMKEIRTARLSYGDLYHINDDHLTRIVMTCCVFRVRLVELETDAKSYFYHYPKSLEARLGLFVETEIAIDRFEASARRRNGNPVVKPEEKVSRSGLIFGPLSSVTGRQRSVH